MAATVFDIKLRLKWTVLVLAGLCVLAGIFLAVRAIPAVRQYLDNYAIETTMAEIGAMPLSKSQEAKILAIAAEMGITDSIIIRKMNSKILQQFGYYNAFAYRPLLLGCIPYSDQGFMYVSEGFLEDLSEAEKRFLIGHELVHLRERHVLFYNLIRYSITLLLLWLSYLAYLYFRYCVGMRRVLLYLSSGLLFYLSLAAPNLVGLAYRRSIEKQADCESFRLLNSYEGCLKLIARWQNDFKMPRNEPYLGLLSDHPCLCDRENYCLELQKKMNIKK